MLLSLLIACLPPILEDTADGDESGIGGDTGDSADTADSGDTSDTGAPIGDADADGYNSSVDCDDADPEVHPGAAEALDWVDDDCDGERSAAAGAYVGVHEVASVGYVIALESFPATDPDHHVVGAFTELAGGGVVIATEADIADGSITQARSLGGAVSESFGYDLQVVDVDGDTREDLLVGDPGLSGHYWVADSALLLGVGSIDVASLPSLADSSGVGTIGYSAAVGGGVVAVAAYDSVDSPVFLLDASSVADGAVSEVTTGHRVSSAGGVPSWGAALGQVDEDGDGLPELLVGAPGIGGSGGAAAGAIFVFDGADVVGSNDLAAEDALVSLAGTAADQQLGGGFLAAGDLDGNGADDVIATTFRGDGERTFYVLHGDTPWTQGLITATSHTTISGIAPYDDGTGLPTSYVSATTRDVDGDGAAELFVGSPGPGDGGVYVFNGDALAKSGAYTPEDADVSIDGPRSGSGFGKDIAVSGGAEGLLVVSAPGADDGSLWTLPYAF